MRLTKRRLAKAMALVVAFYVAGFFLCMPLMLATLSTDFFLNGIYNLSTRYSYRAYDSWIVKLSPGHPLRELHIQNIRFWCVRFSNCRFVDDSDSKAKSR